jgi:hypothetical protein
MKKITCLFIIALTVSCVCAQTPNPIWNATIKVLDESAQPVVGANAEMSWDILAPNNTVTFDKIGGLTDANGIVQVSHKANTSVDLGFQASKTGYYSTTVGHELAAFRDSDPEKWSPHITLILKKIGKPTAMYAKRVQKGPPVFNQPVGYDLMVGDWVSPNGKGVSTDILFTGNLFQKAKNDFDYKLTVSFPNVGDGIQEFTVPDGEKGSALRSPHEAPVNGYQTNVVKAMSHHPGQGAKDDMDDPNRNYFFRVRTVLDHQGNVVSAHYGKIYGDFMTFNYYLNPTPNDRNIEFDPKQNLLSGLDALEQVSQP